MERKLFQLIIVVLSLIPIMDAVTGFYQGPGHLFPDGDVYPNNLDNHYRYLVGVYLAVTFALWWTLGNIQERVIPFRLICAAVIIGGLGRIISITTAGMPESTEYLFAAVIELVLVPLLLVWHHRLRQKPERALPVENQINTLQ